MINLSLGGQRDPPTRARHATRRGAGGGRVRLRKGVVVVAAVGNGSESPETPWNYADYPAALPHVIGVGALARTARCPSTPIATRSTSTSRRPATGDLLHDPAQPGRQPRSRAARTMPYSNCGPLEFAARSARRSPRRRSRLLLRFCSAIDPKLAPTRSAGCSSARATDVTPRTGCPNCTLGRDTLTGWGTLDVDGRADRLAERDDAPAAGCLRAERRRRHVGASASARPRTIAATVDYWDDPDDVYSIKLAKGRAALRAPASTPVAANSLAPLEARHQDVASGSAALEPANRRRSRPRAGRSSGLRSSCRRAASTTSR